VIQNGYRSDGPVYDAIAKGSSVRPCWASSACSPPSNPGHERRGQHVETSLVQSTFVYSYDGMRHPDPM